LGRASCPCRCLFGKGLIQDPCPFNKPASPKPSLPGGLRRQADRGGAGPAKLRIRLLHQHPPPTTLHHLRHAQLLSCGSRGADFSRAGGWLGRAGGWAYSWFNPLGRACRFYSFDFCQGAGHSVRGQGGLAWPATGCRTTRRELLENCMRNGPRSWPGRKLQRQQSQGGEARAEPAGGASIWPKIPTGTPPGADSPGGGFCTGERGWC